MSPRSRRDPESVSRRSTAISRRWHSVLTSIRIPNPDLVLIPSCTCGSHIPYQVAQLLYKLHSEACAGSDATAQELLARAAGKSSWVVAAPPPVRTPSLPPFPAFLPASPPASRPAFHLPSCLSPCLSPPLLSRALPSTSPPASGPAFHLPSCLPPPASCPPPCLQCLWLFPTYPPCLPPPTSLTP